MIRRERIPIVFFAMFCLIAGVWSGLTRIGWDLMVLPAASQHGAIMVGGFLGTLIALEKIIPLKRKVLYAIPLLNALSVGFFFTDYPRISIYVLTGSSVLLGLVFLYYFRTQRTIVYILMLGGAVCWFIGNVFLLSKFFYPLAFPWWSAFALLIITAERLDLMKFLPVSKNDRVILIILLVSFIIGVMLSFHGWGNLICGLSLVGVAVWLLRYDIIGIGIKKAGMTKFIAVALCCGYVALLLTGIFFFSLSDQWLTYDAIVHSFFIGFVFSMIFAHGPMILPGIMGFSVLPFSRLLYVWLVILHMSWVIRIFADVTIYMDVRKVSGVVTAVAIFGYLVTIVVITLKSRKHVSV